MPTGTDLLLNGTLMLRPGTQQHKYEPVLVLQNVHNITIPGGMALSMATALAQTSLSAGLNGGNCDNVSVSGITLQNAYAWNFNIVQSTRVRLFGAKMLGGGNSSEFAQGCDDCWITNCTVDSPSGDMGFAFYGGVTNNCLIGNIFRNSSCGCFILADAGQPAACQEHHYCQQHRVQQLQQRHCLRRGRCRHAPSEYHHLGQPGLWQQYREHWRGWRDLGRSHQRCCDQQQCRISRCARSFAMRHRSGFQCHRCRRDRQRGLQYRQQHAAGNGDFRHIIE